MTAAPINRAVPDRASSDTAALVPTATTGVAATREPRRHHEQPRRRQRSLDTTAGHAVTGHAVTGHAVTGHAMTIRCYYATDPAARPHCGLLATVRYGRTALCGSCQQQRSTLGKGQQPTPINITEPIDLLVWIAQAHHDLDTTERVLAAAVARARQHRHPWSAIGDTLHISRQAAQQRFGPTAAAAERRTP